MMRRFLVVLALGVLVAPAVASAQSRAQVRDGFTISFGLGGGSATVTCDGCGSYPRESAVSGYLRLGGAISPNLVLAAESNGWTKTVDGTEAQLGSLMGVAQWYPQPASGFYLKGGAGFGSYTETDPSAKLEAVGFGYQIGTGYDVRLGSNFSLTPYVNYIGMTKSDIKVNGASASFSIGANNLQYGLGFTWH